MRALIILTALFFGLNDERLVDWKQNSVKKGKEVDLVFSGEIADRWYVYSSKLEVDGPLPTEIKFDKTEGFELVGELQAVNPKKKHDDIWEGTVHYFEEDAKFIQKIKVTKPGTKITGKLQYQVCINDPEDGRCMNEELVFSFQL